ncbi:MAG: hypothetical protein PW735_08555 [Acidobacteriaceae bacterium]|nr:hypothetical protein [Acidobacteriaceae bacterium]
MQTSGRNKVGSVRGVLDEGRLRCPKGRNLLLAVLLVGMAMLPSARAQEQADDQPDPPARVARIAVLNGQASFEPASVNEFSPAEINYPMTTGDRLYTGSDVTAEVQTGQLAARLGEQTDFTVVAMTDTLAQFGLAAGSLHLRSFGLEPGETVELDTPNVAFTVLEPGDLRVDVDPNQNVSYVRVFSGRVQVNGVGYSQVLESGSVVGFSGSPVQQEALGEVQADGLDTFSFQRDQQYEQAAQAENGYLNDGTVGGEDLAQYGDWSQDDQYGAVWYPSGVAADWQPYQVGHWTWVAPWGWTWVGAEPWGFAPFHYGRWARFGPRWGWIPGPRMVRPVWAPALVVFVGGSNVTAWFPLGPREVYSPWYHTSPLYMNRVNVTNLWVRDTRNLHTIYNQRTVYAGFSGGLEGRQFAYRDRATAMAQQAFASGRSVRGNQVAFRPADAQLLPHPMVTPQPGMMNRGRAVAVPARPARPVLDMPARTGNGPKPGTLANPTAGNGQMYPSNPGARPTPGGGTLPVQPRLGQMQNGSGTHPVAAPSPVRAPVSGQEGAPASAVAPQPVQPQQNQQSQHVVEPHPGSNLQLHPIHPGGQPEQLSTGAARHLEQPMPSPQPRDLVNRSTPPENRPSFDSQRQAIQATDPGRPLSPQQMDSLRRNQPVQREVQREAAPHPQAQQPHPSPAPRSSAQPHR